MCPSGQTAYYNPAFSQQPMCICTFSVDYFSYCKAYINGTSGTKYTVQANNTVTLLRYKVSSASSLGNMKMAINTTSTFKLDTSPDSPSYQSVFCKVEATHAKSNAIRALLPLPQRLLHVGHFAVGIFGLLWETLPRELPFRLQWRIALLISQE